MIQLCWVKRREAEPEPEALRPGAGRLLIRYRATRERLGLQDLPAYR